MLKNDTLQWGGVFFVIAGHLLNAMGNMDPYNIIAFAFGTIFFLIWALRVRNNPQILVNIVSIAICASGLFRAAT